MSAEPVPRVNVSTNENDLNEASPGVSPLSRGLLAHRSGNAVISILVDKELRIVWAAESITTLTGHRPAQLEQRSAIEFIHPDDVGPIAGALGNEILDRSHYRYPPTMPTLPLSCRIRSAAGRWVICEAFAFNHLDDPAVEGILLVLRDASLDTALAAVGDALASGQDIGAIAAAVRDAFSVLDHSEAFVLLDPVFPTVVGDGFPFPDSYVAGGPWMETLLTGVPMNIATDEFDGFPLVRHYASRRGHRALWVRPVTDPSSGRVRGCLSVLSSIAGWPRPLPEKMLDRCTKLLALTIERDQFMNRLRHAAYVDSLTGVLARSRLFDELDRALTIGPVTVFYVDLDGFKQVNDIYGHTVGDNLLRAAAERIRAAVRPGDLVGRLGGDEFAVVCTERLETFEAYLIAARIVETFQRAVSVNDVAQEVTVSVGLTIGDQFTAPGDVIVAADQAMYRAKQSGKNRWSL